MQLPARTVYASTIMTSMAACVAVARALDGGGGQGTATVLEVVIASTTQRRESVRRR
jgi:hypothetical protein